MSTTDDENYWDIFISYASEDREDFALPLANNLKKNGLKVWIDAHELFVGDSLKRKIEEGLSKSRFGVVILSKNFFKKEWPQKELDALISKDNGKSKVILPIWHKVSKSFINKYSILLADKFAVSSNIGLELVTNEILKVVVKSQLKNDISLSSNEIDSIRTAINYYRSREGNYSSTDPLVTLIVRLNKYKKGMKTSLLNKSELSNLLKVIDENIDFLNKYEYTSISISNAINNKQQILVPLFKIRNKLLQEISARNK